MNIFRGGNLAQRKRFGIVSAHNMAIKPHTNNIQNYAPCLGMISYGDKSSSTVWIQLANETPLIPHQKTTTKTRTFNPSPNPNKNNTKSKLCRFAFFIYSFIISLTYVFRKRPLAISCTKQLESFTYFIQFL